MAGALHACQASLHRGPSRPCQQPPSARSHHLPGGAPEAQRDVSVALRGLALRDDLERLLVKALGAAVHGVVARVLVQLVRLAIKRELAACDAAAHPPERAAHLWVGAVLRRVCVCVEAWHGFSALVARHTPQLVAPQTVAASREHSKT